MASMAGALLRDVPKAPKYQTLDFADEQIKQAQANAASLPYLQPLARDINRFMAEETQQSLRQALPDSYDKIQENIKAALEGQIPADVEEGLRRRRAELGIARGTSGSQGEQFAALRDLGLTSLSRTDLGLQAAERWLSLARSPTFDISSGFVPIQQRMSIRLEEQKRLFERQWLRNKLAAIPQGAEAALITLFDNIEAVGRSVLTTYAGGAMGGGGGGAGAMMGGGGGGGGSGGGGGAPNSASVWSNWDLGGQA